MHGGLFTNVFTTKEFQDTGAGKCESATTQRVINVIIIIIAMPFRRR